MSTDKDKVVKFGLLGLGAVINTRGIKLFKRDLGQAKIIAVYDKDLNKCMKYSKEFKCIGAKKDINFFNQDFDFCYVSTPSGSHFEDIVKCFKYKKNVIVEKPPVLKTNQLIKLNNIASKNKLKFYVIYQNRENKAVQFVKKYLKKNKKDKIVSVNLSLFWSRPQSYYKNWHGKWKSDGGVLAQQGAHYIDLLCYLFGKPLKAISVIENISNKLEAEDTHIGVVKFKDVNCTITLTTALRPKDHKASIEIYCQKNLIKLHGIACNKISIENFKGKIDKSTLNSCKKNSENIKTGVGISHTKCFEKIIKNFLYNKKTKPLEAIKTLDTLKLINMLYKSSEQKLWVNNSKLNIKSRLGN